MKLADLLSSVLGMLDRAGVPYMVTGSAASSYHGEPRSTRDLDIVIDPDHEALRRLVKDLEAHGFYVDSPTGPEAVRDRTQFNAIAADSGWKVDFVTRKNRPFSMEEFGRRVRVDLLGTAGYIATREDMVIAKLDWAAESGSDRQLADVRAILDVAGEDLDYSYVERWVRGLGLAELWATVRQTH